MNASASPCCTKSAIELKAPPQAGLCQIRLYCLPEGDSFLEIADDAALCASRRLPVDVQEKKGNHLQSKSTLHCSMRLSTHNDPISIDNGIDHCKALPCKNPGVWAKNNHWMSKLILRCSERCSHHNSPTSIGNAKHQHKVPRCRNLELAQALAAALVLVLVLAGAQALALVLAPTAAAQGWVLE